MRDICRANRNASGCRQTIDLLMSLACAAVRRETPRGGTLGKLNAVSPCFPGGILGKAHR